MRELAVALCRISSTDQASGHSLEAQEASVRNMASEMGIDIVNVWSITQSSKAGTNLKRKDLIEIKNLCRRNNKVKYLLVDRVSRLMREWKLMLIYIFELEHLGVKVVFCDSSQRHLNGDDQISELMLVLEGINTQKENKERAETTISRMKARYQAGYYISHPHQGYIKSDTPGLHIKDPKRFNLLQKACRLMLYKQYTLPQAISWLNGQGYLTHGSKKLDVDHFANFITDRYYCGFIDIKSEGWPKNVHGLHERMLSVREHTALKAIIKKRNHHIRQKHNPD
jgi:DNA invertase Pin-like site-specific DNA recombinase